VHCISFIFSHIVGYSEARADYKEDSGFDRVILFFRALAVSSELRGDFKLRLAELINHRAKQGVAGLLWG
jgi:hypothetical protein